MTAEIAILNKSAVALATDSAVTISSGDSNQKVFDSADKLFELSSSQPIGIMIYNGMQFSGVPIPDLVKEFREEKQTFAKVEDAALAFLLFLDKLGKAAPDSEKIANIRSVVATLHATLRQKIESDFLKALDAGKAGDSAGFDSVYQGVIENAVAVFERTIKKRPKGTFLRSRQVPRLLKVEIEAIQELVAQNFNFTSSKIQQRIYELSRLLILSNHISQGRTGIVVAGFGSSERFPSLVSYETDGVVAGKLKLLETSRCEINQNGNRAFVRPFAQKEMVERFLYGLDDEIQNEIIGFCKGAIGDISKEIFSRLTFSRNGDKMSLEKKTKSAEEEFLRNLKESAFKSIESRSRRDIEDMIQFMPKPELAKMAEALIDLTSMKRKVSVGVETVGGPVDVAVISKADGFVWVKRKHYFPPELNARYFQRLRGAAASFQGDE